MNEQQRAKWAATRAKGKRRYVLLVGSFWAILTLILSPIMGYLIVGQPVRASWFMVGVSIFAVCGVWFGLMMWNLAEQAYHRDG